MCVCLCGCGGARAACCHTHTPPLTLPAAHVPHAPGVPQLRARGRLCYWASRCGRRAPGPRGHAVCSAHARGHAEPRIPVCPPSPAPLCAPGGGIVDQPNASDIGTQRSATRGSGKAILCPVFNEHCVSPACRTSTFLGHFPCQMPLGRVAPGPAAPPPPVPSHSLSRGYHRRLAAMFKDCIVAVFGDALSPSRPQCLAVLPLHAHQSPHCTHACDALIAPP